jgi:hypothetical protein
MDSDFDLSTFQSNNGTLALDDPMNNNDFINAFGSGLFKEEDVDQNNIDTSQVPQNILHGQPDLPSQFIVPLPSYAEIEPFTKADGVCVIKIFLKEVKEYVINGKKECMFRAVLLTPPTDVSNVQSIKYRYFKQNCQKESFGDDEGDEDYHFEQVAPMRWWAKLTGTLDVRIKIFNTYSSAFGGYRFYPYSVNPSNSFQTEQPKFVWIKSLTFPILQALKKDMQDLPDTASKLPLNPLIPKFWLDQKYSVRGIQIQKIQESILSKNWITCIPQCLRMIIRLRYST